MYGPTIASSAESGPAGSSPSWRDASSVQRSATGSVARITSSKRRIRASGVARTQPSAAARRSATAASRSPVLVASGTGSRADVRVRTDGDDGCDLGRPASDTDQPGAMPNQRACRSAANAAFSAAVWDDGTTNVPVGCPGVVKKSTSTRPISWFPSSIQQVPVPS